MRKRLQDLLSSPGFIVIVAFLVRLALLSYTFHRFEEPAVRDNLQFGAETGAIAASIAAGHGFASPLRFFPTGPSAWLAPIYPYLLAGIFKLFGIYSYTSNALIHVLDCAFSALTCWPIAAIGNKVFGKRSGAAAAWLWVVLPTAVFYPIIWVWDTALAALWMALLVAATLHLRGSSRMTAWVGYGALWAVGAMINPSLISVLPFLALWAVWPLRRQFARAAQLAAASALIFACGLAPWTIRNYVVFHKVIPFRSNFGLELWLGNNPEVADTWTPYMIPNDNLSEARIYAAMTEIPFMEMKQREALAFIRTHPADTARFVFRRFADTWLGLSDAPSDLWNRVSLYNKFIIVSNCLISLLSFLGILFAYRQQNEWAQPLAYIMLFFPVLFYVTHPAQRYRHPMDPVVTVLTVYAIAYPLSHLVKNRIAPALQSKVAAQRAD